MRCATCSKDRYVGIMKLGKVRGGASCTIIFSVPTLITEAQLLKGKD